MLDVRQVAYFYVYPHFPLHFLLLPPPSGKCASLLSKGWYRVYTRISGSNSSRNENTYSRMHVLSTNFFIPFLWGSRYDIKDYTTCGDCDFTTSKELVLTRYQPVVTHGQTTFFFISANCLIIFYKLVLL